MDKKSLSYFHDAISSHRDALHELLNSENPVKKLRLGNTPVKDVIEAVTQLKELLQRIDQGNYGICDVCKGEVEEEQLELDCTASVCLDCYSEDQLRALERDLELAAKVQKNLLPACTPELKDVEIAVRSEPAQIVGGDYYDFFECRSGHQGFVVGDVMGKGLAASMLMSNLQASLRILGPEYDDLHELAARLHMLFRYNAKLIRFISLFLAVLDPVRSELYYCNAGHHPPVLWRGRQREAELLNPTSAAIGLTSDQHFRSEKVQLSTGDILVIYTDGLSEARNRAGEEFGEEGIMRILRADQNLSASELLDGLMIEVKEHSKDVQDDLTVLILKML